MIVYISFFFIFILFIVKVSVTHGYSTSLSTYPAPLTSFVFNQLTTFAPTNTISPTLIFSSIYRTRLTHSSEILRSVTNPSIPDSLQIQDLDIVNIFARIAEKEILLNIPGAGSPEIANCCHSGCDSCAFSHVFDSMAASRPKWVAMYSYREFIDGRSHRSKWCQLFQTDATFDENQKFHRTHILSRLSEVPPELCMGTPTDAGAATPISRAAFDMLWKRLFETQREDGNDDGIMYASASDFEEAIGRVTGEGHGAMYSKFAQIFK